MLVDQRVQPVVRDVSERASVSIKGAIDAAEGSLVGCRWMLGDQVAPVVIGGLSTLGKRRQLAWDRSDLRRELRGWGSTTERRSGMRGGQSSMRNVQAA